MIGAFQIGDDAFPFLRVLRRVDQFLPKLLQILRQGFALLGQGALRFPRLLQFLLRAFQRLGALLGLLAQNGRRARPRQGEQRQGHDRPAAKRP